MTNSTKISTKKSTLVCILIHLLQNLADAIFLSKHANSNNISILIFLLFKETVTKVHVVARLKIIDKNLQ